MEETRAEAEVRLWVGVSAGLARGGKDVAVQSRADDWARDMTGY